VGRWLATPGPECRRGPAIPRGWGSLQGAPWITVVPRAPNCHSTGPFITQNNWKDRHEISMGLPWRAAAATNAGGVGRTCVFRPIEKSPAQKPYRQKFVSIRHDDTRPRRYTGGGIRGFISNAGGSHVCLLITPTAHLTPTTLVVVEVSL